MIQDTQTNIAHPVNDTLETIDAIWTSSRKVIIWRQTREIIRGESWAKLSFETEHINVPAWWGTYLDMDGTWTVYDEVGDVGYKAVDKWIRIPLQWNYSLGITTAKGWGWYLTATTTITVDWDEVYTYSTSSAADHTDTLNLTIGKFSIVKAHIDLSVNTSASNLYATAGITVQRI